MDDITRKRIEQHVDELDRLVAGDGAAIYTKIHGGGSREAEFQANTLGDLRGGIELMKAAFDEGSVLDERLVESGAVSPEFRVVRCGLSDLFIEHSSIRFVDFHRTEEVRVDADQRGMGHMFTIAGCVAALIAMLGCAAIGVWTVVGWII